MDKKELTFEQAIQRLEEITNLIQKSECTLDQGIKLYQEGLELSNFCQDKLSIFQKQLSELP